MRHWRFGWLILAAASAALALAVEADARMHAGPPVMSAHHRLRVPSGAIDGIVSAPPAAAYSFRKLRSGYGGKAVQLRRASDNAVLDIGFTAGGDFDTAAATAHCAATSCFVAFWYDQSGNGRDAVQGTPTAAAQPALVFNCLGTKPCMDITGTQGVATVATITPSTTMSFGLVARRTAGTTQCFWLRGGPTNRINATAVASQWALVGGTGSVPTVVTDAAPHAAQGLINGASSVLSIDGVDTTGTVTADTTTGTLSATGTPGTTCDEFEEIFWNGYLLTAGERANLTANQRAYWGF